MPRRRAQGEGSVYYRKSDGRWVATLTLPSAPDAPQQRLFRSSKRWNKAQAAKALGEMKAQAQSGYSTPSTTTVVDLLNEHVAIKEKTVEPGTLKQYTIQKDVHLTPALGRQLLIDFKPRAARKVMEKILKEKGANTAQKSKNLLHAACELAVAEEMIPSNPCKTIKLAPPKPKTKIIWTPDEHQKFENVIRNERNYGLYAALRETGLRIGECLGLKWRNVELGGNPHVYVERSMSREGGKMREGPPKTLTSKRARHISQDLVRVLMAHGEDQQRELAGKNFEVTDGTWVFTNTFGGVMNTEIVRVELAELCEIADVRRITPHYFRHMASSGLKKRGIDSTVIAREMGHSNKTITEDVYIHTDDQQRREAAMSSTQLYSLEIGQK
jgi:integrase